MPFTRTLIGDLALCLSFYTRLPVRVPEAAVDRFASAQWAAPLAGLCLAMIGAFVFAAAHLAGLPAAIAATLAIAATMFASGMLHEDGLADVADGFGGGRTRERKLEIMRDSRIGAFGAAALILSLLLRVQALAAIGAPLAVLAALVAAHMASRALIPAFLANLPPARSDGIASATLPPPASVLIALALGAVGLLCLGPLPACIAAGLLGVIFLAMRWLALKHVGGHTGDVLGALQQIAEIAILLVAAASPY